MVNSLQRAESRMAFGSNLVKPSELFGSVKRTINRNRQSRCQCKHHQQKLLAKQEEQRQQLQDQLRLQGCQSFLKRYLKLIDNILFLRFTQIYTNCSGIQGLISRKSQIGLSFFFPFLNSPLKTR